MAQNGNVDIQAHGKRQQLSPTVVVKRQNVESRDAKRFGV